MAGCILVTTCAGGGGYAFVFGIPMQITSIYIHCRDVHYPSIVIANRIVIIILRRNFLDHSTSNVALTAINIIVTHVHRKGHCDRSL